jgi:phosphoglycerate dehydrogenase-like enzyme
MSGPRLLVTGRELAPGQREEILQVAPGAEVAVVPVLDVDDPTHRELLSAAEVVAGELTDEQAKLAERLRWLHLWTAGADTLPPALLGSGAAITSSSGNGAVPLAEHAMMLMMMLDRDVPRAFRAQQRSEWDRFRHGELAGATLGIVGLGRIGAELAVRARAFGMRVLGVRNRPDRPVEGVESVYGPAELRTMLPECDFVVVTAPLTPATRGMLGEAEFRAMKPTARYLCVSRGALADTAALLRALREGWIAGAGLDAHEVEPLPADSPFWTLPNVVVTPHHGATTPGTPRRGFEILLAGLGAYLAGEELPNLVDPAVGY